MYKNIMNLYVGLSIQTFLLGHSQHNYHKSHIVLMHMYQAQEH
jgi:hypothetical protein